MQPPYIQHEGKVIESHGKFKHVMAITLDQSTGNTEGIARCITSREGDVHIKGYTDRSELYKIQGTSLEKFEITEKLDIENEKEIIAKLSGTDGDFIGLEDPDMWIDEKTTLKHVYFTIPIKSAQENNMGKKKVQIHLGHAVGKDLNSLEMTEPVLIDIDTYSAKEVSIAPLNSKGFRYNLVESRDRTPEETYSIVQVAIAQDMAKPWKYGEVVIHPKNYNFPWIGGHASPGPLLPESFINLGPGKRLGILNGREANQKTEDGKTKYGIFSVGLFIYDYENGKINWVSPEPLIRDTEASTITFASHFVETKDGKGILYAHVDDSFIRAYTLYASGIQLLLSKWLV